MDSYGAKSSTPRMIALPKLYVHMSALFPSSTLFPPSGSADLLLSCLRRSVSTELSILLFEVHRVAFQLPPFLVGLVKMRRYLRIYSKMIKVTTAHSLQYSYSKRGLQLPAKGMQVNCTKEIAERGDKGKIRVDSSSILLSATSVKYRRRSLLHWQDKVFQYTIFNLWRNLLRALAE